MPKTPTRGTQNETVLLLLKQARGEGVTPMQCLRAGGGMGLAWRIRDLRAMGYRIENLGKKTKRGKCGRYVLASQAM